MFRLLKDKRAKTIGTISFILIALALLLSIIIFSSNIQAEKSDQYLLGTFTCENITDSVQWAVVPPTKDGATNYFNFTPSDCLGTKDCDIYSIEHFVRFLNAGKADSTAGTAYTKTANISESATPLPQTPASGPGSPPTEWNGIRYTSYAPAVVSGTADGPNWRCGADSGSADTCSTNGSGFNDSTVNYTILLWGDSVSNSYNIVVDVFNVRYPWCWTPIIKDVDVSPTSGTYEDTFTFTVNVTNPDANTTVKLWTKSSGDWEQRDSDQYCFDCNNQELIFSGVYFDSGDVGNVEFKFNATDNESFSMEAGNPSTIGTNTNECLDAGNDCIFAVTAPEVASGTPVLEAETVNGQQSDASEGWGTNWTFAVNVSNPADGAGDIELNLSVDSGSGFVTKGSQTCSDPCSTSTKFTFYVDDFMCADISSAQYKFTATNLNGSSSVTQDFTIEKDDITFEHVEGNNTISNRSGSQFTPFALRVFDTDKAPSGEYLSTGTNITFSVHTGVSYFTHESYIVETNGTGHVTFDFNASCLGDFSGAPKFLVGNRNWKGETLSSAQCYKATTSEEFNTSIRGDISLEYVRPDGSVNFTQEDLINFLGATTDDCTDALEATVIYNANISESDGFACTDLTQIGANAFTCDYQTDITTSEGYYNTTMYANFSFHYDNQTSNTNTPGLFYIFPVKKLENPRGNSSAGQGSSTNGWGNPNWNFTITASSGDAINTYQVDLLMNTAVNPTAPDDICNATQGGCINQTPIICENCIEQDVTYYRNFTASDQGTWFFRFALNDSETQTSGTDFSVVVEEDDTNISYGGTGNDTTVTKDTQPQNLTVRVFDLDKDSFNVTVPSANVTFKLLDSGYAGGEKVIGFADTNETGHARFLFNVTECTFQEGSQVWVGEIESSESNYKPSISENFTITLDLAGCEAAISVEEVLTPSETFQNVNFTVNATIAAFVSNANNVNATLNFPSGWIVGPSVTQLLGTVEPGTPETVSWEVNATSYGEFNVSVFADSSDAGNDTTISSLFDVHKESLEGSADSPTFPQVITPGSEETIQWSCSIGDYRIATLNIGANTSNNEIPIRVETYNGTEFIDVMHSKYINTSQTIETISVPVLENQINANEEGLCTIKISNSGSSNITIDDVTLDAYYDEIVAVRDVQASVSGTNTTGLETSDELVNVSVLVENSFNESHSLNVNLTIRNSTTTVFTDENTGLTLNALSSTTTIFENINTSTWAAGNYTLETLITGNFTSSDSENRSETLIFEDVEIFASTEDYMCDSTTEEFSVIVFHPFTDTIEYNVSLEMPAGWSYSGAQQQNISTIGNTTLTFNITSSTSSAENVTINATINYTYPASKEKQANHSIEESNSIPVLEVIRETPQRIAPDRVVESSLTIHNKGCAAASSAVITESLSTGWTPANPSILTNEFGTDVQLVSALTDLETNVITWSLGQIQEDRYAVLTYQIKSPVGTATVGELSYTSAWDSGRTNNESTEFLVQTMNYSSESHLQFELEAIQQEAFPQPEVRSAQPNETYNYTLTVGNIGDINATGWTVNLTTPSQCDVPAVYQSGTYDSGSGVITWSLPELGVRPSSNAFTEFNFTVNCTDTRSYIFTAEGIKDTRTTTSFSNTTDIGCAFTSGNDCSTTESFTFSKPSDPRYETLNNINMSVFYNWEDYKVTIGQGYVKIEDDSGNEKIIWQNYSITNQDGTSGTAITNYTLDDSEQSDFVNAARNILVNSYVDSTSSPDGNVTVTGIDYTWNHGNLFEESQDFYANVKVYTYTPLLQNATLYIDGTLLTSDNTSAERTGGWGEEFNFSVETRDRFGRNVTVFLWHEKEGGGFTQIGNFTCVDCDTGFQQINFTYDYNGSDITGIGGWDFKFNATNDDGSSELLGFTYTVERDDINTEYVFPANEVNVNRNESSVFSVRSFDTDLGVFPNGSSEAIGKIYISTVGFDTLFESSPSVIAADDGFFNRTITNTFWCDNEFFLGKHGWYGGTEGSDFVKNNLTKDYIGFRNFTLVGSLINDLNTPDGSSNFSRGSEISFTGSVIDDCGADSTSAATIVYNMSTGTGGGYYATCTADATGACEIQTNSSFPLGYYNITMTSTRSGHNQGTLLNESLFFLGTVPQLDGPRKTPTATTVPWGESPFLFEVNVTNIDNSTTTIQLWISNSTEGYRLENTTQCTNCDNYVFATFKNFTFENIAGNQWLFKFNATDDVNVGINETVEIAFNITTDDIGFGSFGNNNSIVNRSESAIANVLNLSTTITDLILSQNVLDPSTPNITLDEITFQINNGTAYLANSSEEFINGSTNFYREFNPACNYNVGSQNWYVEVNGSSAYSDNITSIGTLKVQIYGDINTTYSSPTGAQEFERGASISLVSSLTDDCLNNVTAANVIYNVTTDTASYLCGPATNATGYVYTCSFDTNGKDVGLYNVTTIGYKTFYNNGTDFEEDAFEIKSTPTLEDARVDISSDGWGVPRTFSVNVTDNTGDTVTVQLWQDIGSGYELVGTDSCISCNNDVISFTQGYFCAEQGAHSFKFNATDTEGNSFETSPESFTIGRDDVSVEYFFGNESVVNLLNSSEFILRVHDDDNQTYNLLETATVTFKVTKQGNGGSLSTVGTNTTNSSGYARFFFTPDQTFEVTKQDWRGTVEQQTCYNLGNSALFNVTTLTNKPELVNLSVTPQEDGWGIERTFNVTVRDTNNTATVTLWRASSATSPNWIEMNSTTYTDVGNFETLSFTQTFSPSLIGTWFYMFNASNEVGNREDTGQTTVNTSNNFVLNNEKVLLEYAAGHNSISNRSGDQTTLFAFRVQDQNGTFLSNFPMKFHVQSAGVGFFTAEEFVVLTNSSGYANFNFNATCLGEFTGAPKFLVGTQNWKITVNDSELNFYQQNDSSSFITRNTSVRGDILLDFNTPDGSQNFTQEQSITFLGATTDDCGDALVTTVVYNANSTEDSFVCDTTSQIGANAFQCIYTTSLDDTRGYYNTTMLANKTLHYDNQTSNTNEPGLFFLFAKKRLDNPTAVPTTAGWGSPNWNFSVLASSGDIDNVLQVDLFMAQSVNPTTQCTGPTCVNQTSIICDAVAGCVNQPVTYYRNFTASDIGTWFFQFKFNDTELTSTSGTDFSVAVEKDETNITYGGTGNDTTVIYQTQPQNLTVRVFDLDKDSFNVTVPSANVTFKLLDSGYAGGEKVIGFADTNETGHARFDFNATSCNFIEGSQIWVGEIESSEPNYKPSVSENFTVTLELPGCEAAVSVEEVLTAGEMFENVNFTVNATIAAFISTANNVNATLNTPAGWVVGPSVTQGLGSVTPGTPETVSWEVNATSYGTYNVSVFADSSDAGNDTRVSSNFNVFKEALEGSADSPTFPQVITPGSEETIQWSCSIGDYRIATLNINANTSNNIIPVRVETYNGTEFIDVLHSKYINTSQTIETIPVPVLENQINANEEGLCTIKISNLGGSNITIDDVTLDAYYDEIVAVRDIQASVSGFNLTGLETSDELVNVSVLVENSFNESHSLNVNLTIRNSTTTVFTDENTGLTLDALSSLTTNFLNINTSTWTAGNYTLETLITGNFTSSDSENRTETLIFEDIQVYANTENYMCDSTTEEFEVIVFHPFTDTIEYNVSLEMPAGWSYSGAQQQNISTIGNTTFTFNITSSTSAAENVTINATAAYTYPSVSKEKQTDYDIEESNSIPVLEVIRESPGFVANRTEFVSRLTVYNKGCAPAEDITLTEEITSGWTAYTPSIDGTLGGVADIPNGEIRYTTDNLGTIREQEYKVLAYFVLPPTGINEEAELRYNLTWGSRNRYEDSAFIVNTSRYVDESRLSFEIRAIDSFKDRSAEANEDILYEFNVTNIGDLNITNETWNVSLSVPSQCVQSNHTGTYDAGTGKITWPLGPLNVSDINTFYLNLNCTTENKYVLQAEGIKDTRTTTSFSNTTGIGCAFSSGNDCSSTQSFTFSKPSDPRYETLNNINMSVFYNWEDYKVTIGQGYVKIEDDLGFQKIIWQNYSITNPDGTSGTAISNYTLDVSEQSDFVNAARNIIVSSFADATSSPSGNVTVTGIDYTWNHGKLFEEEQNLFIDIHPFIFDLPTPVLQTPTNDSLQAAVPVGLSWEAISAPGINISYYVFGDDTDASTLLDTTEENLYLWRDLGATQGVFYWKIIATDQTSNTTSETRQFTLDLCQPNTDFSFAETYPMSYNETTDTITVWGSNGTGYDAMGNNESNPITFQEIFEFGQAVRGVCAVTNPSSGSYAILSRLELGNTTDSLNTTFVRTIGESLSFSKQLQLNFNSTFISGNLTSGGSPFAGSTLSFSGLDATDNEEGQLYLINGSELRLYDTGISHTIDANDSNPFRLYWNGDVKLKSSTLQNWYTIRFVGTNNSLEDLILTNMGEGFFPASTQEGTLTRIRPSGIDTGGLVLFTENTSLTEPNVTIINLQVTEATNDILIQNYTGTADLINPTLNFSNLNWTTGSFSGQINRKAEYTSTTTDAAGTPVANVSISLVDLRGDTTFDLITDSNGEIPVQIVTRSIFSYNHKTGDERGPHLLKSKKFGKNFITLTKQFSAATIETLQLSDNPFTTLSEAAAKAQTGITFSQPSVINYGDEVYTTFNTTGTLNNTPITQSEFFSVFGFDGTDENRKLTLVTTPIANGQFSVNYESGVLSFFNDQTGHNVTPVYSYGGNITISTGTESEQCISMGNLYDYMQANLSEVLTTVDGISYTMFVDLIIGNSTVGGCIVDSDASIAFEDGYTYSFSSVGGYIDLAGITAGGGGTGSTINPLTIEDSVGTQYNPGDSVEVFSVTSDSATGDLVSSIVNVSIYYPNDTLLVTGISSAIDTGFYKFDSTLPSNAPLGTYGILIKAIDGSGNTVNDVLSFKVESATVAAGLALNLFNTIGTSYAPSDIVRLYTTTVNSSGSLVNSTVNAITYYPNGTQLNSGESMLISSGRYEYNFTAPATEGTYRINIDANYSGDETHDTESFLIEIGGGSSGTVPRIQVEAPAIVDINTNLSITTLATNDNGVPTDCDSTPTITIRDTLLGTDIISGAPMTNFGTGLYNYTISIVNESNYLATVSCTVSAVPYTGAKGFSTQNAPTQEEFSITSLTTSSPKYPNEAALIEATFSLANGTDVEPETINLTIWAPPTYATSWATGNKANFQQIGNVWRYTKTIESNPTTGTYIVHLNSSYQGIIASEAIQFRIATGGPYLVYLACPDSSEVGSSLDCNVIIQDEGEAATESTCDVWVDTDGDTAIDSGEPQTQFSKETQPQENVTQPVNINVPDTHPTGFYVARVSCSYANSAQPDSTASDSITLTGVTPPVTPPSGGGGGDGITGALIPKVEHLFDIHTQILDEYLFVKPGKKVLAKITLYNFGTEEIKDATLSHYVKNSKGEIILKGEETIAVYIKSEVIKEFIIPSKSPAGIYVFHTDVLYDGENAVSEAEFEVVVEEIIAPPIKSVSIMWIVILLIIITLLIILAKLFLKRKRSHKKVRKHQKENLKKMVRHIRE